MGKNKRLGLMAVAFLSMILVTLVLPVAHASPATTWSISRSYSSNGNLIYVVVKGGNLYFEADIYRYYYASGAWRGGLIGYFTVQGSTTLLGTAKVTATAYICANGFCYPAKTWEASVNTIAMYLRQYLQNIFATLCYYTNCWSLVSYVQSLIAPYTMTTVLGSIGGVSFLYLVYMALPLM